MVKRRRGHYIKDNCASARPTDHLFFDIESDLIRTSDTETEHRFKMGWACYWRRRPDANRDTLSYAFLSDPWDIMDQIEAHARKRVPLLMIAHNVAYDAGVLSLFNKLCDAGWDMTSIYAANMTVIIVFQYGQYKIKILDNGNFFKSSLAALGDAVDLPKLEISFESSDWDTMKAYCKRDVEIMVKAWGDYYGFLDEHDFGQWGHTIPSQAWNAWRHRFMDEKVLIHGDDEAYKLERASYHGGRTSVFFQGIRKGEQFYYLDVNSMYPAVMRDNLYPSVLRGIMPIPTLTDLIDAIAKYAVIAEVEVETSEPIFPVSYKGRNVYPVGTFWTTLTTPELEYCIDHAMLRGIRTMAVYERAKIFQQYVRYLYPLKVKYKAEGNAPYYMMTKLFLNSLYGRFGMKGHKWEKLDGDTTQLVDVSQTVDTTTGKRTNIYKFGDAIWTRYETGETSNSFPGVAAHVTAYARLHLWHLCQQAGQGHYLYCDTDSLIVDEIGYTKLLHALHDTMLGALKVEDQSDEVAIMAPKFYRFGDTWKRKGVSKNAVELDTTTFSMDIFPSFLSQGKWERGQAYKTQSVTKHFGLSITDGWPDLHGWIHPLEVKDMEGFQETPVFEPYACYQIRDQIQELKLLRTIPQSVMLQLWDYRNGRFRQARNSQGELVDVHHSKWDGQAADLGFRNVDKLLIGVRKQLDINNEISQLRYDLSQISDE